MALYTMASRSQDVPTTEPPHFATLLVMALAPEEVGARIAAARKRNGWTHERFALEAGVGLRTVQRWQKGRDPKTGKSWLPRLGTLMELADLMGVSRSYFVEDEIPVVDSDSERLTRIEAQIAEIRGMLARQVRDEDVDEPRARPANGR